MKTIRLAVCFSFAISIQGVFAGHHEQDEALGSYELEHVSNVYSKDANGNIILQTNWRGTAENFGTVFGTLTLGPTSMATLASNLPVRATWIGQGFLPDGTTAVGDGEGALSTSADQHTWNVELIMDLSDGSQMISIGEIDLETTTFRGKNYPMK